MPNVKEATQPRVRRLSNRPPASVPLPLPSGERLGPYRLCFEIASGGMATLYLARVDLLAGIHRFVAFKQIHAHLMKDPVFVEMFLDEARIASQISHANVCSVFDFGVADGSYYIAMEYLSGEPLSMVRLGLLGRPGQVDGERLAAFAARIIADAAEGIHAAHELRDPTGVPLDVVHRDVSARASPASAARRSRARGTFRWKSSERSGSGTATSAPSPTPKGGGVRQIDSPAGPEERRLLMRTDARR